MKRFFRKSLLVSLFLIGFTMVSMAIVCVPVTVDCGDGSGGSGSACGNTVEEIVDEAWELADVICE